MRNFNNHIIYLLNFHIKGIYETAAFGKRSGNGHAYYEH